MTAIPGFTPWRGFRGRRSVRNADYSDRATRNPV